MDIKGFERLYTINKKGLIFSVRSNRYLKPYSHKGSYPSVKLCSKGVQVSKMVHRLVAETFIPNPNNLPEVNHIDGNKQNFSIDNLEWTSRRGNVIHAIMDLKVGSMKLTAKDRIEIVNLSEAGLTATAIAVKFKVHQTTISRLLKKDTWNMGE